MEQQKLPLGSHIIVLLLIILLPCHDGYLCRNCSSTSLHTQLISSELCVIQFGSLFDCEIVPVLRFVGNKGFCLD